MNKYRQAVSAGLNGAVSTGVDVGSLVLLIKVGHLPVPAAAFLASAAGAVTNFTLNKYVAFRDHSRVTWPQLARFGAVALATAAMMAMLMQLVAVWIGIAVVPAKLACAALVFLAWTYPAQRKLVFKRSASASMSLSIS